MIRIERSLIIDRPVEEVGRYVADVERQTEWTDMTASRKLTEGPLRPGTQVYAEVAMGPIKLGWTWEVIDFDPVRGMSYRTISKSALGMDGSLRLSPHGPTTTRVDAVVEVRTRGLLRLLEPLMRGEIAPNEAGEFDRLKAVLERGSGSTSVAAGTMA
jgi:uncharacterized membrane protein